MSEMFSVASIWSMRYWDMLAFRESPRIRIVTSLAKRERNIAPWPAELAPPTTKTLLALVVDGLGGRGAVVDGGPDEGLDAGHVELAHLDAGRDQEGVAAQLAAVVQGHDAVGVLDPQPGDLLGGRGSRPRGAWPGSSRAAPGRRR